MNGGSANKGMRMKIVQNAGKSNHARAVTDVFDGSEKIMFAVAFLKLAGLNKVLPLLKTRLEAGAKVDAYIGRDFCLTEPAALDALLATRKQYKKTLNVSLAKQNGQASFHPKVYFGSGRAGIKILIGSANLTSGALTNNDEISVFLRPHGQDVLLRQVVAIFEGFRSNKDERFDDLDELVLERYRLAYNRAARARKEIEAKLSDEGTGLFDTKKLSAFHAEFLRDPVEMKSLHHRRKIRAKTAAVQREIAGIKVHGTISSAKMTRLTQLFGSLVGAAAAGEHLWHSDAIFRRGLAALNQPERLIALFAAAMEVGDLPVVDGYAQLREQTKEISGISINTVTEILSTFYPAKFAVFNGNTTKALGAIGVAAPSAGTLIAPRAYARVCAVIDTIRRKIGGIDFTDADAFLNWVYHHKVRQPN
jgi:HKD family nuclease